MIDREKLKGLPIGILDTGLGGLTAVNEALRSLPDEDIVYFGDTGRVPYGSRSAGTIVKYSRQCVRYLMRRDVKAVVVACGTISSNAMDSLLSSRAELQRGSAADRLGYEVPIIGVVEPSCAAAAEATRNGRVAVAATSATIASGIYERELKRLDPAIEVCSRECPLFVPLVEGGHISPDDPITAAAVGFYMRKIADFGADTLILGCTHYPLIREAIGRAVPGAGLIDSGAQGVLALRQILRRDGLLRGGNAAPHVQVNVTDRTQHFTRIASLLVSGRDVLGDVRQIDLDDLDK